MIKLFQQKLFRRFFWTYILVLMLPVLIIGIFSIQYNTSVMKQNSRESRKESTLRTAKLLDREFSELQEIAIQIGQDQDIRKVMFENDTVEWEYARWRALSQLLKINAAKKYPDEIMVYFSRTKEFLNASSYYDIDLFYQRYPLDQFGKEEFLNWIEHQDGSYTHVSTHDGKLHYLLYTRGIPILGGTSQGVVLMMIDWEKIASMFSNDMLSSERSIESIIGFDGQILYRSENSFREETSVFLQNQVFRKGERSYEEYINGTKYLVTTELSAEFPVIYVTAGAFRDLLFGVRTLWLNLFVALFFCLLFGGLLIFFFSRYNFRPIYNLFEYAESGDRKKQSHAYDGLSQVVDRLENLFDQNQKLEQSLEQQLPSMRYSFVNNLLEGLYPDGEDLSSLEDLYQVSFESDLFAVVILSIDDLSEFAGNNDEKSLNLIHFAATNVFNEVMSDIASVLKTTKRKRASYILCFHNDVLDPRAEMERRLDQIHGFMTQTFKVKLSIGASDIVQGLEMVHVGQEQAVVALNQRFLYGIGNVSVFHSETNERNSQYYYPLDKETQLVNHIKQGDKEGAHEILDHVIEENRKREISVQLSYCMMFNMLGTILKVLNDLGMEYDISQLVSQMQEAMLHQGDKTMSQLHQQIQGVIDDICDLINASKESGNVQLKTHILHYLQENYMDSNLSLVWVADQFHLSGPYLSRYFKDQMGMNFADYLCRIRINKAKELLRNPALSINDISTMVGYNSSNSFIRTFKRYESITPGQYREQMGHING